MKTNRSTTDSPFAAVARAGNRNSTIAGWRPATARSVTAGVALSLLAAAAGAQDSERTAALEEIIVTAQKRAENIQDAPISIMAVSADALQDKGIGSLYDLFTGSMPSLRIAPFVGRSSAVVIGMRGLVPNDPTQVTRDSTVGIYIDGVYVGRVSGLGMELVDLERIEVLRGPQGTLFGRNTLGGAVSIVSKRPTGEFGVDAMASYGNRDAMKGSVNINLPKFAGLSVKLSGVYDRRDGWVENPMEGQADYGQVKRGGFRTAALWQPTDNLSFHYAFDWSRDRSTSGYFHITATQQAPAVRPSFITLDTERARVARLGLPLRSSPQRTHGHSLTGEWTVNDALMIRSITAFRKLDSTQWDQDAGALTAWGVNRRFGRISYANVWQKQFSEELQFVGDIGEFKYVFGAYYFKEDASDTATVNSSGTLNATLTGLNYFPAPTPDGGTRIPDRAAEVNVKSKALFGQVTWSPAALAGLHVTAGARYTDDHKDGRMVFIAGADPNLNFNFNSSRVDPMATIAYDITEDITTYVKWSRAYRAGGANTRSAFMRSFAEEELTAWEWGFKADLFDRRARLNVAAYTSKLSDQQLDFTNPAFVSNTETVNAQEKRKIKGIEADLTLVPVDGLMLSANYVYTHAPTIPVVNVFSGLTEQVAANYTPKHAATFSADYEFPAFSFGRLRAHMDFDAAGGFFSNPSPSLDTTRSKRALLMNGRLALGEMKMGGGDLEVALWGRNITNRTTDVLDVSVAGRNTWTFFNEPRSYGLEARVKF